MRKSHPSTNERWGGKHRFEHWYRDNSVYFLTARCRDRFPAFASEQAKAVFWDRFDHYTSRHGFHPWIVSLMSNHFHAIGHLEQGTELGEMMRKLHGSVAKLVNDTLTTRRVPFWGVRENRDYFDGCLRDEKQLRSAYRYVLLQCRRHGVCRDPGNYLHTRVSISCVDALAVAARRKMFLRDVPYPRYEQRH
jgi:REP element-mobilizing transposase RayT